MKTLTCAAATILWCACFPGAIEPAADATTADTDVTTEVADTDPTTTPDTTVTDATTPPDTTDTTTTTEVVDTSVEVDVTPECDDDNDCTGLTVAPCVVGRCTNQRCVATTSRCRAMTGTRVRPPTPVRAARVTVAASRPRRLETGSLALAALAQTRRSMSLRIPRAR